MMTQGMVLIAMADWSDYCEALADKLANDRKGREQILNTLKTLKYVQVGADKTKKYGNEHTCIAYAHFGKAITEQKNWRLNGGFWEAGNLERLARYLEYEASTMMLHEMQINPDAAIPPNTECQTGAVEIQDIDSSMPVFAESQTSTVKIPQISSSTPVTIDVKKQFLPASQTSTVKISQISSSTPVTIDVKKQLLPASSGAGKTTVCLCCLAWCSK